MRTIVNYYVIKRGADILVSSFFLLLFLPLLIIIAVYLRCTGEGQVFYRQERIGFQNRKFRIWKFATMVKDSPRMGTGDITLKNDPRLLPSGKFFRKYKLDELPQLFNLFLGDMSLVGPRPLMEAGFNRYSHHIREKIYLVKPGITGIGSIIFRDEAALMHLTADPGITYQKITDCKGELELWYQQNRCTLVDISLLFFTAWAIAFPHSRLIYRRFPHLPRYHKDEFLFVAPQRTQVSVLTRQAV